MFKIGDKIICLNNYYKSDISILNKFSYGIVVNTDNYIVRIDLYNNSNIRYAYNYAIYNQDFFELYEEIIDNTIINDILVNLNKLEKKFKNK